MAKEKKYITCDGNEAAAHVSYMFSEVAAIYLSLRLLQWRSMSIRGRQKDVRIFSVKP